MDDVSTQLTRIADEIRDGDDFKQVLAELGPDKIRENISNGLSRMSERAQAAGRPDPVAAAKAMMAAHNA